MNVEVLRGVDDHDALAVGTRWRDRRGLEEAGPEIQDASVTGVYEERNPIDGDGGRRDVQRGAQHGGDGPREKPTRVRRTYGSHQCRGKRYST